MAESIIPRDLVFRRGDIPLGLMRVHRHAPCHVHRHDFSELVIVLRGTGLHHAPGGEYPISAGDVFVLHGDQAHGYLDTEDLDLVNILFDMAGLGIPLADLTALPGYHVLFTLEPLYRDRDRFESRLRLSGEELDRVAQLVDRLENELNGVSRGSGFMAISVFMLLVGLLSRVYSRAEGETVQPLKRLARVIGHIENHFTEALSLEALARIGHMSRRTLTRAFRDALGCSPGEYQLRLRVRRAAEILRSGEEPVSEVGFRVGFRDSNYFTRRFKAVMGSSPREFRLAASGSGGGRRAGGRRGDSG